MKKILIPFLAIALIMSVCYPAPSLENDNTSFSPVKWESKNSFSPVTIQNGEDVPMIVFVTVSNDNANAAGVNVKGCGDTVHINAGSSSMCNGNDASDENNPVVLTSDSAYPATGTYQIKRGNY